MTRRRWIYLAAALTAAVALIVLLVQWRSIPGQTRPHQATGTQAQALREAFNADVGKVRIVALVSPTCGACLRGAADLQHDVFATISDPRLRGYIVWVPKLDGQEINVPEATHTVGDPRAGHYWDADSYLVHAYDPILHLRQDAWDVYLLYGPDAHWDDSTPPQPVYWMHQLSDVDGPTLDAHAFADHTRALLG
jgi:hypothetical protein